MATLHRVCARAPRGARRRQDRSAWSRRELRGSLHIPSIDIIMDIIRLATALLGRRAHDCTRRRQDRPAREEQSHAARLPASRLPYSYEAGEHVCMPPARPRGGRGICVVYLHIPSVYMMTPPNYRRRARPSPIVRTRGLRLAGSSSSARQSTGRAVPVDAGPPVRRSHQCVGSPRECPSRGREGRGPSGTPAAHLLARRAKGRACSARMPAQHYILLSSIAIVSRRVTWLLRGCAVTDVGVARRA